MLDQLVDTRSYTTEEIAAAKARSAALANGATLTADAAGQIATMLSSVDALQVIINKTNATITAADTKDVARETRRALRQLIRLTRLVTNTLDSINAGPA